MHPLPGIKVRSNTFYSKDIRYIMKSVVPVRGRSHITSAAGGGVSQRLTIADGGGRRGPGTPDFG